MVTACTTTNRRHNRCRGSSDRGDLKSMAPSRPHDRWPSGGCNSHQASTSRAHRSPHCQRGQLQRAGYSHLLPSLSGSNCSSQYGVDLISFARFMSRSPPVWSQPAVQYHWRRQAQADKLRPNRPFLRCGLRKRTASDGQSQLDGRNTAGTRARSRIAGCQKTYDGDNANSLQIIDTIQ